MRGRQEEEPRAWHCYQLRARPRPAEAVAYYQRPVPSAHGMGVELPCRLTCLTETSDRELLQKLGWE